MEEYLTVVQKAIKEYGVDNIYQISEHYHGLYQDDYCYFTYYNNITGETFKDTWSTAYAAPAFGNFQCMSINDAWDNGLINKELMLKYLKENKLKLLENPYFNNDIKKIANYCLRVEVKKGRKWKGIGFLVDTFSKSYQWGVKLWRSDNNYGTSTTRYCKIYDPLTNRIEVVTSSNINFLDIENLKQQYIKEMKDELEKITIDNIIAPLKLDCCEDDFNSWLEKHKNTINISIAYDEYAENEKNKAQEFKERKMQDLIEWVKTNTDKQGEEIQILAEKIFNKKYK